VSVATFTKSGTKASTPAKLNKEVFGLKVTNHQLLKDAYLSYQASARQGGAKTKTRGMVRGSTAKPWRQKGTGNARFGSKYNPIWRGGGVAFGPTGNENFTRSLNVKAKRQALKQALSLAAGEDRIKIIDSFEIADGKVKTAAGLLNKLGRSDATLIVVVKKSDLTDRATRNIAGIKLAAASHLGVFDVLNSSDIVMTKDALTALDERLGGKK